MEIFLVIELFQELLTLAIQKAKLDLIVSLQISVDLPAPRLVYHFITLSRISRRACFFDPLLDHSTFN